MIDQYIQRYGKRLYGLCMSLCADPHDAEDLYQETWLRVVKSISKYDPTRPFEPWLTMICINTYRNILRRLVKSPFLSFKLSEEKEALLNAIPAVQNPDHSLLYEAIDRLPDKFHIAVILFYFRDMDIAATAQTMGIPEGTVKSRLSKARKMMK